MQSSKLKVIVTRKLPDAVELRMKELFDAELNEDDHVFTPEEMANALSRADVLVPTVTDQVTADIISKAGENLKLIAQFGAGTDNIDVDAAAQKNIVVTNTPGVLTDDTADINMALILAVPRRLVEGRRALEAGEFKGWHPTWMMGHRIAGKRLGIIGMGRMGRPSQNAPAPLACKSTTTIVAALPPGLKNSWRRPIGTVSTRCSRAWTSSP